MNDVLLTEEAAQQIEEALVKLCNAAEMNTLDRGMLRGATYKGDKALTTIRAARAQGQAEQEPVAWMCWIDSDEEMNPANAQLTSYEPKAYAKRKPLYAAPQPVKQEPVAYVDEQIIEGVGYQKDVQFIKNVGAGTYLYAAPVRTKDLTPYEITALIRDGAAGGGWQGFAQRVIAADREKNK